MKYCEYTKSFARNPEKSTSTLSEELGTVHQRVPYIARLTHLENHAEAVELYLKN